MAEPGPPPTGTVVRPFEKQHWHALQMQLADPDGRQLAVDAPLEDSDGNPVELFEPAS
jgi:hypothetical protein